jgi:hypothetical protein
MYDRNGPDRVRPSYKRYLGWKNLNRFFYLPVVVVGNLISIEGQIGQKKVVDDGNLTYFIIKLGNMLMRCSGTEIN